MSRDPDARRPPSADPRHRLGRLGERIAAEHLERLGYALVAHNHRTRYGELDLVAADGDALVFVEVKTRRAPSRDGAPDRGRPWESLTPAKRAQVRRMALAYLAEVDARPRLPALRFDAIGVTIDPAGRLLALEHLEGAF